MTIPQILQEIYDQNIERWEKRMRNSGKRNILGVLINAVD